MLVAVDISIKLLDGRSESEEGTIRHMPVDIAIKL
jgi:hypothetical protein